MFALKICVPNLSIQTGLVHQYLFLIRKKQISQQQNRTFSYFDTLYKNKREYLSIYLILNISTLICSSISINSLFIDIEICSSLSIYLSIYLSSPVCTYLNLFVNIYHQSIHIYRNLFIVIYLSMYLYIYLRLYNISLNLFATIYLSMYLSILFCSYLSQSAHYYISINVSIYLSKSV